MAARSVNEVQYPPEEWNVQAVEDFTTYCIPDVVEPLEGALLINVDRSATIRGNYKFLLAGKETLSMRFPASELLVVGGASSFQLQWQAKPASINIRQNSMSSAWIDIADR
jgi:hypothetical protein